MGTAHRGDSTARGAGGSPRWTWPKLSLGPALRSFWLVGRPVSKDGTGVAPARARQYRPTCRTIFYQLRPSSSTGPTPQRCPSPGCSRHATHMSKDERAPLAPDSWHAALVPSHRSALLVPCDACSARGTTVLRASEGPSMRACGGFLHRVPHTSLSPHRIRLRGWRAIAIPGSGALQHLQIPLLPSSNAALTRLTYPAADSHRRLSLVHPI